ncbi:cadherin repeat domain-containing protein, partial [archaeon]
MRTSHTTTASRELSPCVTVRNGTIHSFRSQANCSGGVCVRVCACLCVHMADGREWDRHHRAQRPCCVVPLRGMAAAPQAAHDVAERRQGRRGCKFPVVLVVACFLHHLQAAFSQTPVGVSTLCAGALHAVAPLFHEGGAPVRIAPCLHFNESYSRREVFASGSLWFRVEQPVMGDVLSGPAWDLVEFTWDSSALVLTSVWLPLRRWYATDGITPALQGVVFQVAGLDPTMKGSAFTRTITFSATADDGRGPGVAVLTIQVVIQGRNDAPSLSSRATEDSVVAVFVEGDLSGVLPYVDATIDDVDDTTLTRAEVLIERSCHVGEDVLRIHPGSPEESIVNSLHLTVSWEASTCKLGLVGAAPVSVYQSVLRAVEYFNVHARAPAVAPRLIAARVWDASASQPSGLPLSSNYLRAWIEVQAVNSAPSLSLTPSTGAAFHVSFPSGALSQAWNASHPATTSMYAHALERATAHAALLSATVSITDDDDDMCESATIHIVHGYQAYHDALLPPATRTSIVSARYPAAMNRADDLTVAASAPLAVTLPWRILWNWNAMHGVATMSGRAPCSEYASLLGSVRFTILPLRAHATTSEPRTIEHSASQGVRILQYIVADARSGGATPTEPRQSAPVNASLMVTLTHSPPILLAPNPTAGEPRIADGAVPGADVFNGVVRVVGDASTIMFSVSGFGSTWFSVDISSGQLRAASTIDLEQTGPQLSVNVTATDSLSGLFTVLSVRIAIVNTTAAPQALSALASALTEAGLAWTSPDVDAATRNAASENATARGFVYGHANVRCIDLTNAFAVHGLPVSKDELRLAVRWVANTSTDAMLHAMDDTHADWQNSTRPLSDLAIRSLFSSRFPLTWVAPTRDELAQSMLPPFTHVRCLQGAPFYANAPEPLWSVSEWSAAGGAASNMTMWSTFSGPVPITLPLMLYAWTRASETAWRAVAGASRGDPLGSGSEVGSDAHVAEVLQWLPAPLVTRIPLSLHISVAGCTDPRAAYVPCIKNGHVVPDVQALAQSYSIQARSSTACDNSCEDSNADGMCDNVCALSELPAANASLNSLPLMDAPTTHRLYIAGCANASGWHAASNPGGNYNPFADLADVACVFPPHTVRDSLLVNASQREAGAWLVHEESVAAGLTRLQRAHTAPDGLSIPRMAFIREPRPATVPSSQYAASTSDIPSSAAALVGQVRVQFRTDAFAHLPLPNMSISITRVRWPSRMPLPPFLPSDTQPRAHHQAGASEPHGLTLLDDEHMYLLTPAGLTWDASAPAELCIGVGALRRTYSDGHALFTAGRVAPLDEFPHLRTARFLPQVFASWPTRASETPNMHALRQPEVGAARLHGRPQQRSRIGSGVGARLSTLNSSNDAVSAHATWVPTHGYRPWKELAVSTVDEARGEVCVRFTTLPGLFTLGWTAQPVHTAPAQNGSAAETLTTPRSMEPALDCVQVRTLSAGILGTSMSRLCDAHNRAALSNADTCWPTEQVQCMRACASTATTQSYLNASAFASNDDSCSSLSRATTECFTNCSLAFPLPATTGCATYRNGRSDSYLSTAERAYAANLTAAASAAYLPWFNPLAACTRSCATAVNYTLALCNEVQVSTRAGACSCSAGNSAAQLSTCVDSCAARLFRDGGNTFLLDDSSADVESAGPREVTAYAGRFFFSSSVASGVSDALGLSASFGLHRQLWSAKAQLLPWRERTGQYASTWSERMAWSGVTTSLLRQSPLRMHPIADTWHPGTAHFATNPTGFTVYGERLYFAATGQRGREVYVLDAALPVANLGHDVGQSGAGTTRAAAAQFQAPSSLAAAGLGALMSDMPSARLLHDVAAGLASS